jgi:hypothetical protein
MSRKRAAWVITWDWFGETRKPRRLLLHILQPRWKVSRVLEHMKFLYLNSELFVPSERLRFLSEKPWRGLIHQEGPRIDKRGFDLVSDVLPFGRLWYGEPNAVTHAITRNFAAVQHQAVIRVYDAAGVRLTE